MCEFDDDGANPSHPGACCKVFEGAVFSDDMNMTIDKLVIKKGYYRHSRYTAQTFVCRHPKACAGTSTDPKSDDMEDMRLEGDELCRVGFTGTPLFEASMFENQVQNDLFEFCYRIHNPVLNVD